MMVPEPAFVGDVELRLGPAVTLGSLAGGERRIIPILGGRITGPRLTGEVLPGGDDALLTRPDGTSEIDARYVARLADGAIIYVVNRGIRHVSPEDAERLRRGEAVDPARIYFRTAPVFETASPDHAWLMRTLFIGVGERLPEGVRLRVFAV